MTNPQTTRRLRRPTPQSLSQLALDLWAALDTEISPPGILDHAQAVPIIKKWLAEHAPEINLLYELENPHG